MIATTMTARAELIVLAAPPSHFDSYYEDVMDEILAFHVAYAREIEKNGDEFIILSNDNLYEAYVEQLGEENVLRVPMLDIWMRDFTVLNTESPVMFRYSAAGQGGRQGDADTVQEEFATLLEEAGLSVPETDLINDGGNFVDDYAGNVVLSRKFLRDNDLSEAEARKKISALTQAKNIAFIEADEQGGLEHADGVVSFVDENTLIINSYPEDPEYARQLKADLRAGLPNVKIHEIVTPYDGSEIYDARFGSACGLYTNALVTPERIYLPQFGIPEDKIALEQVRTATSREVVPIASHQVCHMGGGVRCMSLQLRGEEARKFRSYVQR
ncbi:MAG: agmatine deiminase family protein [Proteobacteria bacterium]|nr:agmatine deiminase family protein [Pseudomonadota bacterium]